MIEFSELTKSYAGKLVLGPVTGTISRGGITALIGPNGAGKSTLMSIIGRLLDPDAGLVRVGDLDVRVTKPRELARQLAILRQENQVLARLTVRDLVGFGRFPHSGGRLTEADQVKIDEAMGFLGLDEFSDRFIDELSGGQRQRAFVAMVLAQDTDYILLDEPLNNLDMRHAVRMMHRLRDAADQLGRTIVVVIHDINFAAAYADRIIALKDGRIHSYGTVHEIMDAELLTAIFETPVTVHQLGGAPTAVYFR